MYFPYFRGKQNELITIRECASLFSDSRVIPIIEPVKESLSGLQRSLEAIKGAGAQSVLIINPEYGDHKEDYGLLSSFFNDNYANSPEIIPGILLTESVSLASAIGLFDLYSKDDSKIAFVHAGFSEAKELSQAVAEKMGDTYQIFVNQGILYRKYFADSFRVLIDDGFKKRTNSKHPEIEPFSDLHVTYTEQSMDAFGDFLIVGDEYSESGGPAYAIAIHVTYIDAEKDETMFIHHFKSIRQDSPTDPAGKFLEALDKLVNEVNKKGSKILKTGAINKFIELHERRHFPGLGYVKKLSMQHHIETLADYLKRN